MDRPTSSKKSKLDIPSYAKQCEGMIIPKVTGQLPSVEERFEIYMIDAEPLLEHSSPGFRLFVSRFTDQILINYISVPEFDVAYKSLANKYRWLYVIRKVWLKLSANEKNSWEKNARAKRCKVDDSLFDVYLQRAIQANLYEQSTACREKIARAADFKEFLEANAGELFVNPSQLTFLVDYSPTTISPHSISFFKVCIHLDYFLDTLFEIDAERTSELIKYAIFYVDDDTELIVSQKLAKLLPALKSSDQHAWIIKILRQNQKHFDVRELSLFSLSVLERFLRRFNPIDYNETQARNVRRQAVDLGIIDLVLDCLSYFAHQKSRCKTLRPSHMDIAYFQIDVLAERRSDSLANGTPGDRRRQVLAMAHDCLAMFTGVGGNPSDFWGAGMPPGTPWANIVAPTGGETMADDYNYYDHSTDHNNSAPKTDVQLALEKAKINVSNSLIHSDVDLKTAQSAASDISDVSSSKFSKGKGKGKKAQKTSSTTTAISPATATGVDFYRKYAEPNNLPPSTQSSNSAVINRREKKPMNEMVAGGGAGTSGSAVSQMLPPKLKDTSKFAKGTGYGSGSATSTWNVTEHIAKKKYDAENVAALLKILHAFVLPKSLVMDEIMAGGNNSSSIESSKSTFLEAVRNHRTDACSMIDEKLVQLLHRSCLRKTLLAYLVNDSLLDITQNKDIYETVFGLLAAIAQSGDIEAYASLFVVDKDENDNEDSEDDESAGEGNGDDSPDFAKLSDQPGPSSAASKTSTSSLRRSKRHSKAADEKGSKEVKKTSSRSASVASTSSLRKKSSKPKRIKREADSDGEVEHTSREKIDVFHFLFLDNWFIRNEQDESERSSQPLLLNQLRGVARQIDSYLSRMARRSDQIQYRNDLTAEDLEVFSGDEDRLRNLSVLSKLICTVIEEKIKVGKFAAAASLMDVDEKASEPSSSGASAANKSNEMEEKYCNQMKPLQFETIPFYEDGSNRLRVSYFYHKDINEANASSFGKNIRRITQEIISLSSENALPLSLSSSVFIRSSEERIHAAKMLVTGPSGTPYANGCFEFDIHFPKSYPNDPMRVNLQTTGNGSVRFNPNLYNCGKVCLSVLNTWSGRPEERWNSETSSLLQVIVSLQSLVLVPEPYFNEPGYQTSIGTANGKKNSDSYNSTIRVATVRWAMLDALKNPPFAFRDVIRRHFYLKRDEITKQIEDWIAEEKSLNSGIAPKLQDNLGQLKHEFGVLSNYFKDDKSMN